MKSPSMIQLALLVIGTFITAAADPTPPPPESVPLIVIEDVPLTHALKNIARQANLNYILDPRVPGSRFGLGKMASEPNVNGRWEDITAHAALLNVLSEHKLMLVTNPVTTVARIAPAYRPVRPVAADQVSTNKSAVIPVLTMEDVLLTEAIRKLAEAAGLSVTLDPKVRSSPVFDPQGTVSFRWEKITVRQALAALVDNYDLVLIEDPGTASLRITLKTPAR